MRLLDRYLLRELLAPLFYCLSGFLILFIAWNVFDQLDDLQQHKLNGGEMLIWFLISLPAIFVEILPMSLLLALLFALTAHAKHHEITAMRAAGISIWRIALPYLGVGVFTSLLVFGLNELWIPEADERQDDLVKRHLPAAQLAERRFVKDFGFTCAPEGIQRTWLVGLYDPDSGEMSRVQLDWVAADGTRRWLTADAARFTNSAWHFFNVVEFRENPARKESLAPASRLAQLAIPELTETPDEIRSAAKIARRLSSRTASELRKADLSVSEIFDYFRLHPRLTRTERQQLHTKLHGRLATPWRCLVVVFIALPFGSATGRRNVFFGVAGSIGICFLYFVVHNIGLAFGFAGLAPPWLAGWLPNITFSALGIWLSTRIR
jgi:lipopolysaccharide export system permease protein